MQLLTLRLRYWWGWGNEPPILRYHAYWRGRLALSALFLLGLATAYFPIALRLSGEPAESYLDVLSNLLYVYGCGAVLVALLLISKRHLQQFAHVAEHAGAQITTGECYSAVPDAPLRLYAKIGLTPATAKWYIMPIQWDRFVRPRGDAVTFEAYDSTGYVTRLLRVGARTIGRNTAEEPEPTPAQALRRYNTPVEMRRYARRVWLRGWGVPPRSVFWCGIGSLIFFVTFGLIPLYFFLVPTLDPTYSLQEALTDSLLFSPMALIGWLTLIWSVALIRTGHRGMRAEGKPLAKSEGVVRLAREHRDPFCRANRSSTYIEFAADDGTSRIFRIPSEFAHRVPAGSLVRVTFMPATEVATDVTLLDNTATEDEGANVANIEDGER